MLAAALILVGSTIDYQTVAKPLPEVLKELSAISGVAMRASTGVEDDKLVIRVDDVEIEILRTKIAETVAGKWSEKDGVFTLWRDEDLVKSRKEAMLASRTEQIRGSLSRFPKIASTEDMMAKWHVSGHSQRAAMRLVGLIDLADMASIPVGYRKVYSTNPTVAQTLIPGANRTLAEEVAEHNRLAERARNLEVDEPALGTPQYRTRQSLIKDWPSTTSFQLICRPQEGGITGFGRFMSGSEVLEIVLLSFNWVDKKQLPLPETSQPNEFLALSPRNTDVARLMSQDQSDGSNDIIEVDPETVKILKTPTTNEPLTLHYSEMLQFIGRRTEWQVVANVRDEMVPMLPNAKPTLRSALDAITNSAYTWASLNEEWLLLAPSEISDLQQTDRTALEKFIARSAERLPTLDDWGSFAWKSSPPYTTQLLLPYMAVFTNSGGGGDNEWLGYRLFTSLSQHQKTIARNGGSVRFSELGQEAQSILNTLLFHVNVPRVSDNGGLSTVMELGLGPSSEPTDLLPRGIPSDSVVTFAVRKSPALLPTPKTPHDISPFPMPVSRLAYNATVDPKVFLHETRPVYPTFRIGTMTRIQFTLPVQGDLALHGYLYEYDIDRNSKIYELATAPK
ncbi:MAG: hypothetical protein ABIV13_00405, partial [Fimbriimonadales bacterium]